MIADPDYARIFTQARILAWQYGYACLAHGSFTRDLDLLLVPWADRVGYVSGAAGVRLAPALERTRRAQFVRFKQCGFDQLRRRLGLL